MRTRIDVRSTSGFIGYLLRTAARRATEDPLCKRNKASISRDPPPSIREVADPNPGDALADLADVLAAAGRPEEAVEVLEQALDRYEKSAMVAQLQPELEALRAGSRA
jgi:thioredoxin-like negative regulator of GroEL